MCCILGLASDYYTGNCRGDFGRLGHGNSSDLFSPQPVKALQGLRIKQIACGDSHCLALTVEGDILRLVQTFSVLNSERLSGVNFLDPWRSFCFD